MKGMTLVIWTGQSTRAKNPAAGASSNSAPVAPRSLTAPELSGPPAHQRNRDREPSGSGPAILRSLGRNARRRAERKDADHPSGTPGEARAEGDFTCPVCGSHEVIPLPLGGGGFFFTGRSLSCTNCGWQGIERP